MAYVSTGYCLKMWSHTSDVVASRPVDFHKSCKERLDSDILDAPTND